MLALRLVLKRVEAVEARGTAACQVVPAPRELHCLAADTRGPGERGRETECGVGCGVASTEEGVEREPGNRLTLIPWDTPSFSTSDLPEARARLSLLRWTLGSAPG